MTKPKVLLTASYGPNDLAWGQDQYDLLSSRLARGHGPFQMTSHCHYFALYLIAENVTNPTTVLENPHLDEFEKELDEGYGVVGFQLKSLGRIRCQHPCHAGAGGYKRGCGLYPGKCRLPLPGGGGWIHAENPGG